MAVALEPHPKEATSGLCFQRLTCSFAHVSQLASPMLPAFGPLKQEPAISHSTRDSVIAMIRRRVNGPPIFERPSQIWPTIICDFLLTAGMCVFLNRSRHCKYHYRRAHPDTLVMSLGGSAWAFPDVANFRTFSDWPVAVLFHAMVARIFVIYGPSRFDA